MAKTVLEGIEQDRRKKEEEEQPIVRQKKYDKTHAQDTSEADIKAQ